MKLSLSGFRIHTVIISSCCKLFMIHLAFLNLALARVSLPQSMNSSEMKKLLEILGPATGTTVLSSPHPLGGWQGIEVGLSKHYLALSYLSEVDQSVSKQKDFDYTVVTIGKGLYYDIDLFLSITPLIKNDSLNFYSSQIRYRFWRSQNNIFHLSVLIYGGTSTISNQLTMLNSGFDLIGTLILDRVSIFIGIGKLTSKGQFIGGVNGLTETHQTESSRLTLPHQLIGLEWPIGNFFVVAETDRYSIPYYSLKIGYRY